jgi:hypothetical protein
MLILDGSVVILLRFQAFSAKSSHGTKNVIEKNLEVTE